VGFLAVLWICSFSFLLGKFRPPRQGFLAPSPASDFGSSLAAPVPRSYFGPHETKSDLAIAVACSSRFSCCQDFSCLSVCPSPRAHFWDFAQSRSSPVCAPSAFPHQERAGRSSPARAALVFWSWTRLVLVLPFFSHPIQFFLSCAMIRELVDKAGLVLSHQIKGSSFFYFLIIFSWWFYFHMSGVRWNMHETLNCFFVLILVVEPSLMTWFVSINIFTVIRGSLTRFRGIVACL
jgi:hypothetical protein